MLWQKKSFNVDGTTYTAYIYSPSRAEIYEDGEWVEITDSGVYYEGIYTGYSPDSIRQLYWGILDFSDQKDSFVTYDGGETYVYTSSSEKITISIEYGKISQITITDTSSYAEAVYSFYDWGTTY